MGFVCVQIKCNKKGKVGKEIVFSFPLQRIFITKVVSMATTDLNIAKLITSPTVSIQGYNTGESSHIAQVYQQNL